MPRGLGLAHNAPRERFEEEDYRSVTEWRPIRAPPVFVPALLPQPSIDDNSPVLPPPRPVVKAPTKRTYTGEEARRMYIEALSGRAREVGDTTSASASTSGAVTPLLQTGETREDAIDLDSPPETPEVIMVEAPIEEESDVGLVEVFKEEEAAIRHCDACAIDVAEHSWSTHVLSLPHLLAAEPGPNLVLPPHIALQGPGRRMLEATGWTQGEGLGLDGRGRPVPIRPVEKHDRLGIGLKLKPGERKKKLAIIGESGAKRKARQAKDKVSWQRMYSYIRGDE